MKKVMIVTLAATMLGAIFSLACGSDNPPPPPTMPVANPQMPQMPNPQMPQMPNMPQMPQMPNPQMPQMPQMPAAGGSNFGTVSLNSGFMPDPHVAQGTSGGTIQASTWNAACTGWVTAQPDHLFVANTNFANLKVMVASAQDVTLVIQSPTGQYMCNDDTEGTNPVITGAFPPGTYKVWVGSYQQGANSPYRLGFTEIMSYGTANLGQ